jgi:Leucine Rich repeat
MKCCFKWTGPTLAWLLGVTTTMFCSENLDLSDLSNQERAAVIAVEKLGGKVKRDKTRPGRPVFAVRLASSQVADEDIAVLVKNLPEIRWLSLYSTQITDKGLERLKGLSRLTYLSLLCQSITDDGLKNLQGLTSLRELDLTFSPSITDEGLKNLQALTKLRELGLSFSEHITGRGLLHLTKLTNLRKLVVMGIPIGDEETRRLKQALPNTEIIRGNGNTAQKRIRRHFAIPESTPLKPDTIRAALLAAVPKGSSRPQVLALLKNSGIGKDTFSYYYTDEDSMKDGGIGCRITFDPDSGELVHTHYWIGFLFDGQKRLTDVEVKEWYTGP